MDELANSYQLLGLQSDATADEAKQAYRDLVNVWHPDRFAHDERLRLKAQEKLKEINAAYEIVKASFREIQTAEIKPSGDGTEPQENSATPEPARPPSANRALWIVGALVAGFIVVGILFATMRKQNSVTSTEKDPNKLLTKNPRHALAFDGNARVEIAATGSLSGTFTVECWAMTTRPRGTETILCSRGPKDCSFNIKFREGKRFHADIGDGSRWLVKMANVRFSYNPGTWYHIAYVVTPTNYNIYVNGERSDYRSIYPAGNPLLYDEQHRLCLGADLLEPADLDGSIAEFRIWRTARTAEQIRANMHELANYREAGLQGIWSFTEGTGSEAFDGSGHGFTAELIGHVEWTTNLPPMAQR